MPIFIQRGATFWPPTIAGSARQRNLLSTTACLAVVLAEGDHREHIAVLIEWPAEVVAQST